MKKNLLLLLIIFCGYNVKSQSKILDAKDAVKCRTYDNIKNAVKADPTLISKWKLEGERQRSLSSIKPFQKLGDFQQEIIIPVVFHIVDVAANQKWVSDRDVYTQIEILNEAYRGKKASIYKKVIPKEMWDLVGKINIKFVLARRTPSGALTSGIERRNIKTPAYKSIKSTSKGGIDPWDVTKYINIWVGTFSGADEGLLGVATPPFYTSDGPQGIVIGTATLPYSTNVQRSYYASYNEGATLVHELGHYFYLWHTFGDMTTCNNDDFWTQPGWDLPNGAGPEGDDTPEEKDGGNAIFGNPSQNYSDGCTNLSYGEMYGSFMNYFDDRALFMFSKGHMKRVQGCIELYRPGLVNSSGAIAYVLCNALKQLHFCTTISFHRE
ncbi:MAG: M43 family zinc metalloprotease, partial [Ginsengibacter sp.]